MIPVSPPRNLQNQDRPIVRPADAEPAKASSATRPISPWPSPKRQRLATVSGSPSDHRKEALRHAAEHLADATADRIWVDRETRRPVRTPEVLVESFRAMAGG